MTKIINASTSTFKRSSQHRSFSLKYFNTLLLTGLIGLGVFYLILVNDITVQGFVLQKMNSKIANLSTASMNSQEEINLAQSSNFLNSHLGNLDLVAVNNVKYLVAHDSLVAKR